MWGALWRVYLPTQANGESRPFFWEIWEGSSRSIWLGPQNSFEIKSRSKGSTSQNAAEIEEWGLGGGDFCRIYLSSPHNSPSPKLLSTMGRPTFFRHVLFFLASTAPELTVTRFYTAPNPNVTSAVCHPAQMGEHCLQLFRQNTASYSCTDVFPKVECACRAQFSLARKSITSKGVFFGCKSHAGASAHAFWSLNMFKH